MPFSSRDATHHTKKAKSAKSKRAFAHAANGALDRGLSEGAAVRIGNAAAAKTARKRKR